MKRIGLITIHDTVNFGSLLQTFALYKAIEEMGADLTLIDYKCRAIQKRETLYNLRDCRKPKDYVKYIFMHKDLEEKYHNFWQFIRKYMKVSEAYDELTIDSCNDLFDSFIVGSDIVWGMEITGCDFNYMLEFVQNGKDMIAFSASVGEEWDKKYEDHIRVLLSRFSQISVREERAARWMEFLLDQKTDVTCDPTMLMDSDFWDEYTSPEIAPKGEYILVYLRTKDKRNIEDAIKYGNEHNMPVYYINYGKPIRGIHNIKPTRVWEWLSLIRYGSVVFTASYHGFLFSIYFHKSFFFYYNTNVWRMQSLSKMLDIPYREGNAENIRIDRPVDYDRLEPTIHEIRRNSKYILRQMLVSNELISDSQGEKINESYM